jgi:hypothetical protein
VHNLLLTIMGLSPHHSHIFSNNPSHALFILDLPLRLDLCDSADVVLRGEHKLVIGDPLWLAVEHCRRMQTNNLGKEKEGANETS